LIYAISSKFSEFLKIFLDLHDFSKIQNRETNEILEKYGNSRKSRISWHPHSHTPSPSTFMVAAVYRVFLHEGRVLRRK
jgi:hypothetical protein